MIVNITLIIILIGMLLMSASESRRDINLYIIGMTVMIVGVNILMIANIATEYLVWKSIIYSAILGLLNAVCIYNIIHITEER